MVKRTFDQMVALARNDTSVGRGTVNCTYVMAAEGRAYPRTCARCGLGPCPFYPTEIEDVVLS